MYPVKTTLSSIPSFETRSLRQGPAGPSPTTRRVASTSFMDLITASMFFSNESLPTDATTFPSRPYLLRKAVPSIPGWNLSTSVPVGMHSILFGDVRDSSSFPMLGLGTMTASILFRTPRMYFQAHFSAVFTSIFSGR